MPKDCSPRTAEEWALAQAEAAPAWSDDRWLRFVTALELGKRTRTANDEKMPEAMY